MLNSGLNRISYRSHAYLSQAYTAYSYSHTNIIPLPHELLLSIVNSMVARRCSLRLVAVPGTVSHHPGLEMIPRQWTAWHTTSYATPQVEDPSSELTRLEGGRAEGRALEENWNPSGLAKCLLRLNPQIDRRAERPPKRYGKSGLKGVATGL